MPQKELDLLEFSVRSVAEPSTGSTQIMRRQLRNTYRLLVVE